MSWNWRWREHEARRCITDAVFVLNINDWAEFLPKPQPLELRCGPGRIQIDTEDHAPDCGLGRVRNGTVEVFHQRHVFQVVRQTQRLFVADRRRWWFVCPQCCRRVAKLYLVDALSPLGCRHCQRLRYPGENGTRQERLIFRHGDWAELARDGREIWHAEYLERRAELQRLRRSRPQMDF